ncbi:MAG: NADPH-dependent FMN reductase [Thermoanaerobaculia bacterium]|nr:NADPH-dependent FMN reductase [Thermoanaerobaculia bacterium]
MSGPHLVISCSLREGSHSRILAGELAGRFRDLGRDVRQVDLGQLDLPLCDGGDYLSHPDVVALRRAIEEAASIAIATPIYNFEVGGATRNLVAVTGRTWTDKVVGFLCAAGGRASYMSVMTLANSLMLDFRCLVVPRFVYAVRGDFDNGNLAHEGVADRVSELARDLDRISAAVRVD